MKDIIQYRDYSIKSKTPNGKDVKKRLQYFLGKYNPSTTPPGFYGDKEQSGTGGSELIESEESGRRYLRMWYGDGQLCDGKPRVVEVQFSCCPTEHISNVDEVAVCHYVMQIHTPKVCKDPVFKASMDRGAPKQSGGNPAIVCEPILTDAEYHQRQRTHAVSPDDDDEEDVDVDAEVGSEAQSLTVLSPVEMRRRGCTDPAVCDTSKPLPTDAEVPPRLDSDDDDDGGLEGGISTLLAGAAAAGMLPFQDRNVDVIDDDFYDHDDYDPHPEDPPHANVAGPNDPVDPDLITPQAAAEIPEIPVTPDVPEAPVEAPKDLYAREFTEELQFELEDARLRLLEILRKKKVKGPDGKAVDGVVGDRSRFLREELEEIERKTGGGKKAVSPDDDDEDEEGDDGDDDDDDDDDE
ncbi:Protein OS-9 [Dinochytrium kinnereticum]|nr:Protein OS-9 [Dinochytrium kinnereticum]